MKIYIRNAIMFASILILVSCTNTYLGRYVIWNFPKSDDYKRMPFQIINKSTSNEFKFERNIDKALFSKMDLIYNKKSFNGRFGDYLNMVETNAFVVIRNDTIIYEKYFNNFNDSSISCSFSVTKSVTSSLVGIAIDKHFINSINDKIIKYIPELDSVKYGDITIRNLLNMSSGFSINHNYLPWDDEPKTYYSPDIRKLTLNNLQKVWKTDTHFFYNNYNPFLLGMIIERATHKTISKFLEENLWTQIGTSHNALFAIDSKKHGFEKVEAGLSATALDFAKFGRLYLNDGNWNGRQIISKDWVNISSSIDIDLVDKKDYYSDWMNTNKIAYRNAWWQRYDKNLNCHTFMADGLLGQLIWIYPQKKIIIVRLGKGGGGIDWYSFLTNVVNQL